MFSLAIYFYLHFSNLKLISARELGLSEKLKLVNENFSETVCIAIDIEVWGD